MRASRITTEYGTGVEQFLQFTEMHAPSLRDKYFFHVICHGMIPNYTNWIWHGELPDKPSVSHTESVEVDRGCRIEDMIRDLG